MNILISWEGNPQGKSIRVDGDTRIGDIIKRDLPQFANASDHFQDLEAYKENGTEELSKDATISNLKLKENDLIHFNRCTKIDVTIHFEDKEVNLDSIPSGYTLKKVERKAIKALQLDLSGKILQLSLKGSEDVLDESSHIGSFTTYPNCEIELCIIPDLVEIKIKDKTYDVIPKTYLASELKQKAGISEDYILVQFKNGKLDKLEDDQKVKIKGGEVFKCQAKGGKSS